MASKKSTRTRFGYEIRVKLGLQGAAFRKLEASIERTIKGLEPKFTKRINDYFRRNFSDRSEYERWKRQGFDITKNRLSKQFIDSLSNDPKHKRALTNLYAEAWKKKYQDTINKYREADPTYKTKEYYKMKKKLKAEGGKARHNDKTVRFTTWGLSTGDLRDSIYKGFKAGGKGGVVKIHSLAVQGAYTVDWQSYPINEGDEYYPYPIRFMNLLINKGVIDNYEDFIDFLPSDWDLISDYIMLALKTDFTDIMKQGFQQLASEGM